MKLIKKMSLENGNMMLYEDNENAVFNIFGDICAEKWGCWSDDICPADISNFLSDIDKFDNVDVHINSGGGDAFAGIAIYNILKRHSGNVTVYIDGLAASAASVIAMAGDKIIMPVSAQLMVHQPWTLAAGNADELRKTAESLDLCANSIMSIYNENKADGIEDNTIKELVDAETWLSAEQSKQYFARVEIEEKTLIKDSISSNFYCKYKNKPKFQEKSKLEISKLQLELWKMEDNI